MKDLTDLEIQMLEIDERLRPFATRAVDTNDPNWMTLLAQSPHPLDDAGVRSATDSIANRPRAVGIRARNVRPPAALSSSRRLMSAHISAPSLGLGHRVTRAPSEMLGP